MCNKIFKVATNNKVIDKNTKLTYLRIKAINLIGLDVDQVYFPAFYVVMSCIYTEVILLYCDTWLGFLYIFYNITQLSVSMRDFQDKCVVFLSLSLQHILTHTDTNSVSYTDVKALLLYYTHTYTVKSWKGFVTV